MQFDPFTDAAIADPYPHYAALRADDPVHWSDKLRAWVLFRYDDVAMAFRDDARFSADRRRASRASGSNSPPAAPATLRTISSDPPECLVVRAILNAALVPRVRAIGPRIDAIVEELAAGLAGRTEVDLVADFAYALPIRVIAELLDVPEAEHARFQHLSRTIARGMDRFYGGDDVSSGLHEIGAYFVRLVTERTDTLGDDLLRRLLGAEHHGDRLSQLEAVAMCTALVFGGHETTVNLIANGMRALLRHPAELLDLPPVEAVDALPVEQLPALVAGLAALQARAAARLAVGGNGVQVAERDADLLEAKEAAKLLKMSEDWLYKNAKRLPFTRRVGLRSLRFSAEGIRRYLRSRRP